MVQIYDRPSVSSMLAEKMGTGLGQGLQQLAQYKLQDVQQRLQSARMKAMGLPENLAYMNPQVQAAYAKYNLGAPERQQAAQALNQILGTGQVEQQGGISALQQMTPGQQTQDQVAGAMAQGMPKQVQPGMQPLTSIDPRTAMQMAQLGMQKQKMDILRGKEEREASTSARKELAPKQEAFKKRQELSSKYENVIKAAQSGKLLAGGKAYLSDVLHLNAFTRNPTTEQAQANINALATGVSAAFGPGMGRILAKEFEAYKDSLIRIWNTPQGMVAIARNELLKNQLEDAKHKARIDIMRLNKGRIPFDIDTQIDEVTMPIAQRVASEMDENFKEVVNNKMPAWGNKDLNPALYKEGTVAELVEGGSPYKVVKGMWVRS